MKVSKILVLLLILTLLLSGCSKGNSPMKNMATMDTMDTMDSMQTPSKNTSGIYGNGEYMGNKFTEEQGYDGSDFVEEVEQKKIKRGNIQIEVKELNETYDRIRLLLGTNDGYIHGLREYSNNRESSMEMVIKVKSNNFESVYDKLKEMGKVREANMSSQDVTREYIDTKARIETLLVQEQSLKNIMAKAEKVEDLLRVESELQRVRQDIESSQGNLNYLDSAIDYSELNVSITMVKEPEKVSEDTSIWDDFLFNIKDGFGYWTNVLLGMINTLLWLMPIILIILLILIFGKKKIKSLKDKIKELINRAK